MKKKIIITLYILLGIASIMLCLSIFLLYTEAEKVQRSIFMNEVLTAGDNVVKQVDATIKGDTMMFRNLDHKDTLTTKDTADVISVQHARHFLLDSVNSEPIGIVNSTIYSKQNNSRIMENDTEYFSNAFRRLFPIINQPWEPHQPNTKLDFSKIDPNLVRIDTGTLHLINKSYLTELITECLAEENIDARFDFALYNALTTEFIIEPASTSLEKILHSEYVFRLINNEKICSPHYIILYFPQERGIYLQRMSTLVTLIIVFLIVNLTIAFTALISLYRQKKLSEVTNDFVNNMTHEFKTPISTISLACEALSDPSMHQDAETQQTYIQIIHDENERLKNMITNILQIAQLRKGQIKMNIELIDVHELIRKVTDSIALQVSSHNGTLQLALNADHCKIFGDRNHLTYVIVNLVENGIKYSPEHPEILINTISDNKYFILSVTDKGIGIPKQNIKDIFKNFYRVPKGNVHDVKGYGLGLGYVKKIVSLHNGRIEVESEVGKGSTFVIYLPFKKKK